MTISRIVHDWNQTALIGATVDLRGRDGQVREAGRIEDVHGNSRVSVRFKKEATALRYSKELGTSGTVGLAWQTFTDAGDFRLRGQR